MKILSILKRRYPGESGHILGDYDYKPHLKTVLFWVLVFLAVGAAIGSLVPTPSDDPIPSTPIVST